MPKHKAIAALLALDDLRDCGDLTPAQHQVIMRISEELQDVWQEMRKQEEK